MRLIKIKLSAFKSFADATVIHVAGQRLAVVGPNGCGKSNVIDAVRWVLGEASASRLRGDSMQDVIFNGAGKRPAASRAAVELVFDNSDFSLAGLWGQYSEIAIKRTLNRTGESAYFINQKAVRRRDITELFAGTGVGARGYAVIEQGMISRIIEASPVELAGFIEEAAGIAIYKERRRESEKKLTQTRSHLQRLVDIDHEINQQIAQLSAQAAAAQRYRQYQQRLAQAEIQWAGHQWQAAQQQLQALSQQWQAEQQAQTLLQQEQAAAQDHKDFIKQQLQVQQQQLTHVTSQLHRQREALVRDQTQKTYLQALLERRQMQEQAFLQRESALSDEEALRQQKYRSACDEQQRLMVESRQAQQAAAMQQAAQSDAHQAQAATEQVWLALQTEFNQQQAACQQSAQALRYFETTQARLVRELAALSPPSQLEDSQAAQQAAAKAYAQAQEDWQALQAQLATQQQALKQQQAKLGGAKEAERRSKEATLALRLEIEALRSVLPKAWQVASAETLNFGARLQVTATWQKAVSLWLQQRLRAEYAPELGKDSPVTVWVNQEILPDVATPKEDALIHQTQIAAPFQAALQLWLAGVRCVATREEGLARQHELALHEVWLTPLGEKIDAVSVEQLAASRDQELLTQKSRLEALLPQMEAAQYREKQAQLECQRLWQANHEAQQQWQQQQSRERAAFTQQQQAKTAWQIAKEAAARQEVVAQQERDRRQQLQQEKRTLEQEVQAEQQRYHHAKQQCEQLQAQYQTAKEQWQNSQAAAQRMQQQCLQAEKLAHEMAVAWAQNQQQLAHYQQEAARIRAAETALAAERLQWQQQGEALAELTPLESKITTTEAVIEALEEQRDQNEQLLEEWRQKEAEAAQLRQHLFAKQHAGEETLRHLELKQQEVQFQCQQHAEALKKLGQTPEALSMVDGNVHACQREISYCRRQMAALGEVFMGAPEALAALQERQQYYQAQKNDIEMAMQTLEAAIAKIDAEGQRRFDETLLAVNVAMKGYFAILFGGGDVRLQRLSLDAEKTGLNLMAQPPGKKNSTIHLLSGGEKALVAMSLVFALFAQNPAPFCFLDEVDAPLDDANTLRFCQLVGELSAKTQFLYVSHKRQTMEMAEVLIGVTMAEKGVSQIVDVDLNAALNNLDVADKTTKG